MLSLMLEKIKQEIENANTIAVFGHEVIDWDALGAILGFGRLLEKQWKTVSYFTPNKPSHVFDFLHYDQKLKYEFDYWDYDLLVFLDFNQYSRIPAFTGWREDYFDPKKKIIIDHHKPEAEPTNTLIYRDPSSISTCSLVYEITKNWWKELFDEEIATYFYTWLSTDSWNFRFDEGEQSVRAFRIAADLLELWAHKKEIIDEVFRSKSYRSVQFMQLVLWRMQKLYIKVPEWEKVLSIIYSYYDEKELEEYHIDHDEADYALHVMQDIRNNDLVIFIKKIENYIKVSLRWRWDIDCSLLANLFWWGGHHNASWLKIQSCWYLEKDIQDFLNEIEYHFQKESKLIATEK
jgi:nanoRNase/pAp phosphatase (c-di-AMP/oligoRNAs hydrolase)